MMRHLKYLAVGLVILGVAFATVAVIMGGVLLLMFYPWVVIPVAVVLIAYTSGRGYLEMR